MLRRRSGIGSRLPLIALIVVSLLLVPGCKNRPQRKLLTDGPGENKAGGLNWKCGLLGGALGAVAGAGATFGGTALATDEWPLQESVDWAETFPVWGSAIFLGSVLGMYIACLGP